MSRYTDVNVASQSREALLFSLLLSACPFVVPQARPITKNVPLGARLLQHFAAAMKKSSRRETRVAFPVQSFVEGDGDNVEQENVAGHDHVIIRAPYRHVWAFAGVL